MEVVTICMALGGGHLESLLHESWWQDTALYLMIDCPNPQVDIQETIKKRRLIALVKLLL